MPVVKCKVTPAVTHAEDEKPLKEDAAEALDYFLDNLDDEEETDIVNEPDYFNAF